MKMMLSFLNPHFPSWLQPRDSDEGKQTLPTLAECLRVRWNSGEGEAGGRHLGS